MERRDFVDGNVGREFISSDMNFSWDKKFCIECCARKGIIRDTMVVGRSVGTERNQKSKS
jgi:hypothetical protein